MSARPNASACGSAIVGRYDIYGELLGILSTSMQTSIPRPQILFIDGLPGSGKSMAAEAVGPYLSNNRVFLGSAAHPLLVATPDRMGAAFADIHKMHSEISFAAAALGKLESFLETAACDVL